MTVSSPPPYHRRVRHVARRQDGTRPSTVSEPVLLILVSLADKPRHGYALMKDVEALSGGRVRLRTGTLYGALRRLLESGWITPFTQKDTSREKQAYRLTALGSRQLTQELARLRQIAAAAAARLSPKKA